AAAAAARRRKNSGDGEVVMLHSFETQCAKAVARSTLPLQALPAQHFFLTIVQCSIKSAVDSFYPCPYGRFLPRLAAASCERCGLFLCAAPIYSAASGAAGRKSREISMKSLMNSVRSRWRLEKLAVRSSVLSSM